MADDDDISLFPPILSGAVYARSKANATPNAWWHDTINIYK